MYNSNDITLDIFLLQPYNKREKQFNLSPVSLWQWKSNCPGSELFLDDNDMLKLYQWTFIMLKFSDLLGFWPNYDSVYRPNQTKNQTVSNRTELLCIVSALLTSDLFSPNKEGVQPKTCRDSLTAYTLYCFIIVADKLMSKQCFNIVSC